MTRVEESAETKRKAELFQCWYRGWKHGTGANAVDRRFRDHEREDIWIAYDRGYQAGRDASAIAAMRECERLGYDPQMSILRGPAHVDPPATESRGTE